jgi:hypothetical protein
MINSGGGHFKQSNLKPTSAIMMSPRPPNRGGWRGVHDASSVEDAFQAVRLSCPGRRGIVNMGKAFLLSGQKPGRPFSGRANCTQERDRSATLLAETPARRDFSSIVQRPRPPCQAVLWCTASPRGPSVSTPGADRGGPAPLCRRVRDASFRRASMPPAAHAMKDSSPFPRRDCGGSPASLRPDYRLPASPRVTGGIGGEEVRHDLIES